ncbi:MAG: hypothetical protein ACOCZT_02015, partial [Halanaerobiales bacterium]
MKINKKGSFVIDNYQDKKVFSSFLPGIAGENGIPIWAYYVNRGQCVSAFGIENKDNPILEFLPANKAYQTVSLKGYRTFLKFTDNNKTTIYEPFSRKEKDLERKMIVSPESIVLSEKNSRYNIETEVKYFILSNTKFAALVRKVRIKNLDKSERKFEILDGVPEIIPYGLSNIALKEVSQTMSAWCRVYNLENKVPYYRVKASTSDSSQVHKMEKGNFYLAFTDDKLLSPIVDNQIVFGEDMSFQYPEKFIDDDFSVSKESQKTENRFPAAMVNHQFVLASGEDITINSLFGHLSSIEKLAMVKKEVFKRDYSLRKEEEALQIHQSITDNIRTVSSYDKFDNYCQQTFLDNILRGGYPKTFKHNDKKNIYHLFSRKHGDLERDYNYFHLEASFYSQGNGNYRDVNQNRRCDNFFNPEVKEYNIKTFVNLIQLDGYNPLVIKGSRFTIAE